MRRGVEKQVCVFWDFFQCFLRILRFFHCQGFILSEDFDLSLINRLDLRLFLPNFEHILVGMLREWLRVLTVGYL